jgi:gliding motility-associated-like protein
MKSNPIGCALFVLACSYTGMLAQIPTNGLVAYYPFDENANDLSENGNHGIIYSVTPATNRCAIQKKAFEFDGLKSEIVIPNSAVLDNLTNISLCAWVKPTISFYGTGNNAIIDKGYYSHNNPYYQYHLGITGNLYPYHPASFAFAVSINNEYCLIQSTSHIWSAGIWYFVVGTYDGNYIKLYINGEIDSIEFKPGVIDHFGKHIHIGKFGNLNAYTPAVIDDIRIYNRALFQNEILILYKTECTLSELNGESEVCQGQQNVAFYVNPLINASLYEWNYSGLGATIHENDNQITIDFADDATSGKLSVTVTGDIIDPQTRSLDIHVNNCTENPSLFNIPNSFSPDGDGVNDVFFIRGLTNNSTLIIYDRSGKKLFETSNYQNDWDGRDNKGTILESDTYWYVFYPSGYPSELKGFIYLKR